MNKSIVVIFHVEDQAVWIEDIRLYPYSEEGLKEALSDKEDAFSWDYVHDCAYILNEDEAQKLLTQLNDAKYPYMIYDYMRANKNNFYLEDIII